ncbi:hypothetical protein ROZALSC1DRAFT_30567 [Rozella allomycis CSF55]|uniref:Uncharacterized protein n=1 Tax=Rozella allomycis (strain CSF55) TaxID=988480 RepID=A0A075AZ68_ROZAC|nr:hypothetical protein O9G_004603 [Rozella allomycis CSF55]RKP17661.1 hypothetical protein ROZALSC1DRAFT_30567 [Rozella allomycis CSF55]|eukprot:EPZ34007.1 hypothetical protein O9G_004603 [Rozella allomycis CSF55]
MKSLLNLWNLRPFGWVSGASFDPISETDLIEDLELLKQNEPLYKIEKNIEDFEDHDNGEENTLVFEKDPNVYVQSGELKYQGIWFKRGDVVVVINRKNERTMGEIIHISPSEIWIKKPDSTKKRLYVSHLNHGRFTMKHRQ